MERRMLQPRQIIQPKPAGLSPRDSILPRRLTLHCILCCGLTGPLSSQAPPRLSPTFTTTGTATGAPIDWDNAFNDQSGSHPVHFVAAYLDGTGKTHRLEEWRTGLTHLRRRTDASIDLHADAATAPKPGQPVEYQWHVLDLPKKIDHSVSTQGLIRAGMLYSFYAMAHVLTRPAGRFEIHPVQGLSPVELAGNTCQWYQITAQGQPASRVCWASTLGIPLRTLAETQQGWRTNFELQQVDQRPIPATIFAVNDKGFQVRKLEELEADD